MMNSSLIMVLNTVSQDCKMKKSQYHKQDIKIASAGNKDLLQFLY